MVNVAIHGARGYLGRECMRLLLQHPHITNVVPVTSGAGGAAYGDSVPGFRHRKDLVLRNAADPAVRDADVHLLATDAAEAQAAVPQLDAAGARLVVDLSRAHRAASFEAGSGWTYGLSEAFPVAKGTRRIANPGCYPTATLLAALPLLRSGLAAPGPLIADGKSGVSGAGATPRPDLHFAETNESVRAYKVLGHDHQHEIHLAARQAEGAAARRAVRFTPHLVPQNRGLLSTVYVPVRPDADPVAVKAAYEKAYAGAAFVRLVHEPDTTHVRHSNFADVAVDVDTHCGLAIARGAIDNLVKGGSGQAVQNVNLAMGWAETAGLPAAGGGP